MATQPVVMETVANLEKLRKPGEVEFRPSQVEIGKPGVWCVKKIKEGELFGPYVGEKVGVGKNVSINYRYAWEVYDPVTNKISHIVNATKPQQGNWMRYVNCARYFEEQNIVSVQLGEEIYYKSIKTIEAGDELLTWFDLSDRNDSPSKKTDRKKKQNESKTKTSRKPSGETSGVELSQSPRRKIQPCITASLLQKKPSPQKKNVPEKMVAMDTKSPTRGRDSGKKSSPQKNKDSVSSQKTPGKVRNNSPTKPNQTPPNKETIHSVTAIKRRHIDDKDSPNQTPEKKKRREIQTTVAFKISKKSSTGNVHVKTSSKATTLSTNEPSQKTKTEKNSRHDPQFFHFQVEKKHQVLREGHKFYSCDLCDTLYQKPFSLKRHFLRTHINCQYVSPNDLSNCCIDVAQQQRKILNAQQASGNSRLLPRPSRSPSSRQAPVLTKAAPVRNCVNGVREGTPLYKECFPGLYKCDVCFFLFDEMSELSVHINDLHKNDGKTSANAIQTKNKKSKMNPTSKPESKNSKMVGNMLRKIFQKNSQQDGEKIRENKSEVVNGSKLQTRNESSGKSSKKSKNGQEESETKVKKDSSKTSSASQEKSSQDKTDTTSSHTHSKRETKSATNSIKTGKSPGKCNSRTKGVKNPPASGGGSKVDSSSSSQSAGASKLPSTPEKNRTKMRKQSPRTSPRLSGSPGAKGKKAMKPRGNKYIKQKFKHYPCTLCKVRFTKLENLNKHLKDHQENKSFPCYFCGKNFMNETKMKQHVRYHFGQNVGCRHCPQRFPNVGDMRHHLATEHKEEWLIKQSEEEEERKQALNTKKSQRRRVKRVRVISEEDYRNVLTESKLIQPKIKDSFQSSFKVLSSPASRKKPQDKMSPESSSPTESLKILSSPISRKKIQEDCELEPAANGYKSKYRYSCFTCRKRFVSYHSLVQHRKTSHRYDRYKAPSSLLHVKQKVSEESNPIGALPMLSPPVSPDPYYDTIGDNVKTNLACFLDGHEESLKNFKRHIQINGYKSINSVSPVKTANMDWTSFNFPFHYEPYESVIGYNRPDSVATDTGSATYDLSKPEEEAEGGGYLRSGSKRKNELRLDLATDDPPLLTCMSELSSPPQLTCMSELSSPPPISRRQSAESEGSMPSLTPPYSANMDRTFFSGAQKSDSLNHSSKSDSLKKEQDENMKLSGEENVSGCHGDIKDVNDGRDPENKPELSFPSSEDSDPSTSALNSLCVPSDQQRPSPSELIAKKGPSPSKSVANESGDPQRPSPSATVVKETVDLLQPSPSAPVAKEPAYPQSPVPPLRALDLIQASQREEVVSNIQAANESIPAHVVEKEMRETLSAQTWDGYSEKIAFGKLGAITNVCSVCYRFFDTTELLNRHQWTKHSSMQYRHLQVERGLGIDSLFYSWPCNEGLVAASTPVPEDCHSLPVYKCTRCKSSFKNISRLHVHIISCDPRKLFYVQRISFKEKRRMEEKERKRIEKLKVKEEKGKQRKLNRLSQAKAQIQMKRNAEKVKKMIRARQEAKSPKKSSPGNSPAVASQKIPPRNPRDTKPDLDGSSENSGRVTRQRKRRNYELLYKPDNHVRRRATANVVETHQCSGCGSKFRTLFLLERHARKCSEKEKLRSSNPGKESHGTSKTNQQHNCQYCGRKFTYLKSLSNHYSDFCAVKKEKKRNGQLQQEQVELEMMLKEELQALDGSKRDSGKVAEQGNVAGGEAGKKRCGWPRGMKRKHRRKNHCWTYTKKKKVASGEGSRLVGEDEDEERLLEDEDEVHQDRDGSRVMGDDEEEEERVGGDDDGDEEEEVHKDRVDEEKMIEIGDGKEEGVHPDERVMADEDEENDILDVYEDREESVAGDEDDEDVLDVHQDEDSSRIKEKELDDEDKEDTLDVNIVGNKVDDGEDGFVKVKEEDDDAEDDGDEEDTKKKHDKSCNENETHEARLPGSVSNSDRGDGKTGGDNDDDGDGKNATKDGEDGEKDGDGKEEVVSNATNDVTDSNDDKTDVTCNTTSNKEVTCNTNSNKEVTNDVDDGNDGKSNVNNITNTIKEITTGVERNDSRTDINTVKEKTYNDDYNCYNTNADDSRTDVNGISNNIKESTNNDGDNNSCKTDGDNYSCVNDAVGDTLEDDKKNEYNDGKEMNDDGSKDIRRDDEDANDGKEVVDDVTSNTSDDKNDKYKDDKDGAIGKDRVGNTTDVLKENKPNELQCGGYGQNELEASKTNGHDLEGKPDGLKPDEENKTNDVVSESKNSDDSVSSPPTIQEKSDFPEISKNGENLSGTDSYNGEVPSKTGPGNGEFHQSTNDEVPSETLQANTEMGEFHFRTHQSANGEDPITRGQEDGPTHQQDSVIPPRVVVQPNSESPINKQDPKTTKKQIDLSTSESTELQERKEGSNSSYAPGEQAIDAKPDQANPSSTSQEPNVPQSSTPTSTSLDVAHVPSEIKSSNVKDENIPSDEQLPNNPCCLNSDAEDKAVSLPSLETVDNNNKDITNKMEDRLSTADDVGHVESSGDAENSNEVDTSRDVENSNDVDASLDAENSNDVDKTCDVENSGDETDHETGLYSQDTETDTDVNYNAETETENDVEMAVKNKESIIDNPEELNLFERDYFPCTKVPDFHFMNKESNSKVKDSCDDVHQPTSGKESDGNGCLPTIVDVAPDSDVSR